MFNVNIRFNFIEFMKTILLGFAVLLVIATLTVGIHNCNEQFFYLLLKLCVVFLLMYLLGLITKWIFSKLRKFVL